MAVHLVCGSSALSGSENPRLTRSARLTTQQGRQEAAPSSASSLSSREDEVVFLSAQGTRVSPSTAPSADLASDPTLSDEKESVRSFLTSLQQHTTVTPAFLSASASSSSSSSSSFWSSPSSSS
eukprot:CAMPEP_0177642760 /NCGR_PEP_ID=MMETSP0447-20121125/7782_1 /TAXON_ID=0 /ORGANISM="Stygamoeba regulata, Strain BSH-02190019" /LENGTH=123 /DNA_ID=CAMNT_0019144987 /DNA_START=195 /DNA_END=563 /DNA_ORIENTATION=+